MAAVLLRPFRLDALGLNAEPEPAERELGEITRVTNAFSKKFKKSN